MGNSATMPPCRIPGCGEVVPSILRIETLCPEHFIEFTILSARQALDRCEGAQPVDQRVMDWLFSDAAFIARDLTAHARALPEKHREQLFELLLCLTNLHEYVKHHSVELSAT